MRHLDAGDHPSWDIIHVGDQEVMALIRQKPFSRLLSWAGVEQVPGGVDGFGLSDATDLHSGILAGSGIESWPFRHQSIPGPNSGSVSDATTFGATPLPPPSLCRLVNRANIL
ncbi:hypothetical protein [Streptomyces sp. NPDC003077]|uniref:hypothetical protein n=1 Tax=Streptomyces sp. NPDC003077 TaxID=3154443 RepID=UPI0033A2AEA7